MDAEALGREHYNAAVSDIRHVNHQLVVLRVRPDATKPAFEAGQWTFLGLGLWEPRCAGCPDDDLGPEDRVKLQRSVYSLSSSILADGEDRLLRADEEDVYEFYIGLDRTRAAGATGAGLAARAFALQPGSRLWVADGAQGTNTLQGVRPDDDVVFLATGTGEAPHNRMVAELLGRQHRGRIASIVTVRHANDLAYRDVHQRLSRMFDSYRWHGVVTRDAGTPGQRLQAMLESGELENHAGIALHPEKCHVFLCGNAAMVGRALADDTGAKSYPQPTGMIELLEQRGFRAEPLDRANIHFERY